MVSRCRGEADEVRRLPPSTQSTQSTPPPMEKINQSVLDKTVRLCRERKITIPTFAQLKDPSTVPPSHPRPPEKRRPLGYRPGQPLPHHLEERTQSQRRRIQQRQLARASPRHHRRPVQNCRPGRQVLPHRRAQSRRGLRLPRAAAGHRPVRSHHAKSRLAQHRQLLPRRRLR